MTVNGLVNKFGGQVIELGVGSGEGRSITHHWQWEFSSH
jgi:hypothetical protein